MNQTQRICSLTVLAAVLIAIGASAPIAITPLRHPQKYCRTSSKVNSATYCLKVLDNNDVAVALRDASKVEEVDRVLRANGALIQTSNARLNSTQLDTLGTYNAIDIMNNSPDALWAEGGKFIIDTNTSYRGQQTDDHRLEQMQVQE